MAMGMRKFQLLIAFALFAYLSVLFKTALAGEPLAIFGDWYFFKYVNKEHRLQCYIMSIPKSRYDNFNRRGQSFFTVLQERDLDYQEVYSSHGIIYNKNIVDAEIEISKNKFPLLTFKDKAWAYNKVDDKQIIELIKKALFFSVVINYENNRNLMDVYSSSGFAEAFDYLTKNCR
jgi:hypothetical protein